MINVSNVSLTFGQKVLFKDVNIKFTPGNCYGLIGANGSGKSTFLKVLSGDIEPNKGTIDIGKGERIAVLKQDQFAYDEYTPIQTVIMGHQKLMDIMTERDAIYSKPDFSDEDGHRAGDLEELIAEMDGYNAEANAASLLSALGLEVELHEAKMSDLEGGQKVRVLLAQALFGNPDILLLDEPTNNLDIESISWLENFLLNFKNTVIVVSHDRHFLNKVCTHTADIDFQHITVFAGNYDFWAESSQLAAKQRSEANKKTEAKMEELKTFIARFSANASKSKQATSRKKLLESMTLDEMPRTSRRFPYVDFKPARETGNRILDIHELSKTVEGVQVLKDFSLTVNKGDKIAFVGTNNLAKTTLFQILNEEIKPDSGSFKWGETITRACFPKDNTPFFAKDMSIFEWLQQYTTEKDESFVRGFLGRMLFTGEESLKKVSVLSGGEKVRCMLSRMMMAGANALILDEPTNHLDLESITALNDSLIRFPEVILFSSHDHQFIDSIATRIIEFTPGGVIDRTMTFDEYIEDKDVKALRDQYYHGHNRIEI